LPSMQAGGHTAGKRAREEEEEEVDVSDKVRVGGLRGSVGREREASWAAGGEEGLVCERGGGRQRGGGSLC